MVIVHQAAVADGAIEDLDFGPVGKPAAGGGVFGFGGFHKLRQTRRMMHEIHAAWTAEI
jgi:hypothetical protein